MRASKKTLKVLAGMVWYIGGIMLLKSGVELVQDAVDLRPFLSWHWLFIGLGIVLGIIQALTIFTRSCQKNLGRINQLNDPRLWQFFRPGFFLALALMITGGVLLDYFSRERYFFMLAVAAVDFALTISLIGSSYVFWLERKLLSPDQGTIPGEDQIT